MTEELTSSCKATPPGLSGSKVMYANKDKTHNASLCVNDGKYLTSQHKAGYRDFFILFSGTLSSFNID